MLDALLTKVRAGDVKSLSRAITIVENELPGCDHLLLQLHFNNKVKITGLTGPPGAGKSTLADALIGIYVAAGKRVAVLCIDPSSPFTDGALLGDRIRMSKWYNHPAVFIRSLASRGLLGGLHPAVAEICDLLKLSYDHIIIETVGVGQNETGIAAIADTSVVILVPEAGDDIQSMKSGLLEIADIIVVNKADRPGADLLLKDLRTELQSAIPIFKTTASNEEGVADVYKGIQANLEQLAKDPEQKHRLITELAFQLLIKKAVRGIDRNILRETLKKSLQLEHFNLYRFINEFEP